jgi:hypothetical protein
MDFVHDQLATGRKLRVLAIIDERDLEIEIMKEPPQKIAERAGSSAASCVWLGAGSLGAAGLHPVQDGAIGVELPGSQGSQGCARGGAHDRAGRRSIRATAIAASASFSGATATA